MEHNELEVSRAKEIAAELKIPIYFKLTWDRGYQPVHTEFLRKETGLAELTRDEWETVHQEPYMNFMCKNLIINPQINWDGRLLGCCEVMDAFFDVNVVDDGLEAALKSDKYRKAKKCLLTSHPGEEDFGDCVCYNCSLRRKREFFDKKLEL